MVLEIFSVCAVVTVKEQTILKEIVLKVDHFVQILLLLKILHISPFYKHLYFCYLPILKILYLFLKSMKIQY